MHCNGVFKPSDGDFSNGTWYAVFRYHTLKTTSNFMNKNNETGNLMPITVTEGVTVNVLPNKEHEYLMSTKEVAHGYGTTDYSIRKAFLRNSSELKEGKHFIKGVDILSNPSKKGVQVQPHQIFWTKRGVVRIGFFITSERAKLFRDVAEELIIRVDEQQDLFGVVPVKKALPAKRKHNRITSDRLIRLLQLTHRIEDSALRNDIVNELMGGQK